MNFKKFKNIDDYYKKTGINRISIFDFLLNELKKLLIESEGKKNEKKSL